MSPEANRAARLHRQEAGRNPAHGDWISEVTERLRQFRDARGWAPLHTPRSLAMSVAIETGELLEHFQWGDDDALSTHIAARREEIADEIADVAVYLLQLADILDVSLRDAVDAKVDRNELRFPRATRGRHNSSGRAA